VTALPDRGDRITLISTNDPATRLRPGDQGTVTRVTTGPYGSVGVRWDDGSGLSLIPGLDRWQIID
jgi:hypothetical protein